MSSPLLPSLLSPFHPFITIKHSLLALKSLCLEITWISSSCLYTPNLCFSYLPSFKFSITCNISLSLPESSNLRTPRLSFLPVFCFSCHTNGMPSYYSLLHSLPPLRPSQKSLPHLFSTPSTPISGVLRCMSPSPPQTCFLMYVGHLITGPYTCCSLLYTLHVMPHSTTAHFSPLTAYSSCLRLALITQTAGRRDSKIKKKSKNSF